MFVPKEIAQNLAMLLPPIRSLARSRHYTGLMNEPSHARRVFEHFTQYAPVAGKDVVDLGVGQSARLLQHAREAGAASTTGLDVIDYFNGRPPVGISIRIYDGRRMPLDDASVDLIWSNDCFEHVHYPEMTVLECARVLRPGGTLICEIDLKSHYHGPPEEKANHLRYSSWLWKAMAWNRGAYTNRVRASEWSNLFARSGFQVRVSRTETSDALQRVYRARPDLRYSEADFITTMLFAVLDRR